MPAANSIFFPDKHSYDAWIERIPGVMRVLKEGGGDELEEEAEGPYFYSPQCLILRVHGYYSALVRVDSREEADFTWYVAANQDEGEEVFAALLCDSRREDQPAVVGDVSIQGARAAITAFLGSHGQGRLTRHLWPVSHEQP